MANPHHEEAKGHAKAKMKALTGFAKGGRPHSDEAQDRKLFAKALHEHEMHFHVHGKKGGGRLDRYARGGKVHHKGHKTVHNHVTVVAPAKEPVPVPAGPPPGAMGGGAPPPGLAPRPPVPTMMPPPGMSSGPMPSPAMRKHGGFVKKYAIGGAVKGEPTLHYARGGSIGQPGDRERGTLGRGQQSKFLGLKTGGKAYIEGEVPGNEKKWAGYAKKDSYAGAGHFARGGGVSGMPPKKVQPIEPPKKNHFGVKKPTNVWAKKNPSNNKPGKLAKVAIIKKFGQGSGMGVLDQASQLKKRYP